MYLPLGPHAVLTFYLASRLFAPCIAVSTWYSLLLTPSPTAPRPTRRRTDLAPELAPDLGPDFALAPDRVSDLGPDLGFRMIGAGHPGQLPAGLRGRLRGASVRAPGRAWDVHARRCARLSVPTEHTVLVPGLGTRGERVWCALQCCADRDTPCILALDFPGPPPVPLRAVLRVLSWCDVRSREPGVGSLA